MSKHTATRAKRLLWRSVATASALAVSSQAHGQVRGVVDVSVQGTAASRPFLEGRADEGAVSIGIQIDPSIYYEGAGVTTAVLRGTAAIDQYDAEHGTVGTLGITGGVRHKISGRTSIGLNASARSTRSGVRDFLRNPGFATDAWQNIAPVSPAQAGGQPGPAPEAEVNLGPDLLDGFDPDLTEAGGFGRTNSYQLGASLNHALSPFDSIALSGGVRFNRSDDPRASDYRSDSLALAYRRSLSSRTSLNAQVSGGRADYDDEPGPGRGDGTFITPTVGISHRFSETLTMHASAGASFTEVEGPDGAEVSKVGFAGDLGICQLENRGSLCATASRGVQPTSFGGVTSVTSAGVTYGRILTLRDRVSLSARYTRRDDSLLENDNAFDVARSVFAVSAGYNRRIGERLYAFLSPSYAKTFGGHNGGRENYQVSVGIRYRIGRPE